MTGLSLRPTRPETGGRAGRSRGSRIGLRHWPRRLAALILALAAGGCTLAPHYERPGLPVPAAFPDPTGPAAAAGQPGGAVAADIGWRNFLGDPRLLRLVETALESNRDLRVAVLAIAQARSQYQVQRAALFPVLNGTAGGSRSRTPADESLTGRALYLDQFTVGGAASWTIDFFGRAQSLRDAALEQYLAAAETRRAAEIALVAQVADQYLLTVSLDEAIDVTRGTIETAQASLALVDAQFHSGTGTELSLAQARAALEQARANLAAQLRARAQADNALSLLIGAPLPGDLPPGARLAGQTILADIPAGLPADLLARRPDILAAEANLRSQNANIGAARAAFFPRITLTGTLGSSSSSLNGLFKAGSAAWAFAPALTVPIFDAGVNAANLDVAEVQKKIAIAQYEKSIQSAFRDVADGLAARGTFGEQIEALERLTAAQQRRLDLSDLRYRGGVDSYLNVLTAQNDLYGAQQALITARLLRLTALVDLYRALGGGWVAQTGDPVRPGDSPVAHAAAQSSGR